MIPTLIGGVASQSVFNDATGGTVATVTNYNGTGKTWRVHTFEYTGSYPNLTSSSTFSVTKAPNPFTILIVGGGGSGGRTGGSISSCGGGGYNSYNASQVLNPTSYTVTVGGGGWSTNGLPWPDWDKGDGAAGGTSSISGVASANGGSGGTFESGGSAPGGSNVTYSISGSSVTYGPTGTYGFRTCAVLGLGPYGANRAGSGVVIIAYQIS